MATVKDNPPSKKTLREMKQFFYDCAVRRMREEAKKKRIVNE